MNEVKGIRLTITNSSDNNSIDFIGNVGPFTNFQFVSKVAPARRSETPYFQLGVSSASAKGPVYVDDVIAVNLTQTFGAGNELSKPEMDAIGWFDGTVQVASKSDSSQVDFNVSAEEGYNISTRVICNSGYATFENGILSIRGMNQDTVCRIESIR